MPSLPGKRYIDDYPPDQLWRLLVDGRFWAKEKGGQGYEDREPGSIRAGLDTLLYFVNKANDDPSFTVSLDFIKEIHSKCGKGVEELEDKSPGETREGEAVSFGIPANRSSIEGVIELLGIDFLQGKAQFGPGTPGIFAPHLDADHLIKVKGQTDDEKGDSIFRQMLKDGYDNSTHFYIAPQKNIEQILSRLTAFYNRDIKKARTVDEKIAVIAKYTKYYELLHPFKDANGRTFVNVLMNIMLMKEGLPPATFYEPNVFDLYSTEELAEVIKESMYNTLHIINAHKMGQSISLYGYKETEPPIEEPSSSKKESTHKDDVGVVEIPPYLSSVGRSYPIHWITIYETDKGTISEVVKRNAGQINKVIKQGAPPIYVGRTPLHIAAIVNNKTMFDELIKHGANINVPDFSGKTILHYIAEYNNLELLKAHPELLNKTDLNTIQDANGKTALHYAAASGNCELIQLLVAQNKNVIDIKDKDNKTALHYAAQHGHNDIVNYLIKQGAHVDPEDINGDSPLSLAYDENNTNIVTTLLYSGSSIPDKTLDLMAQKKDSHSFNEMLDKNPELLKNTNIFKFAVRLGDTDIVRRFISAGIDLDTRLDSSQTTALMQAASFNNRELILLLLEFKADITLTNKYDENFLHMVAYAAKPEILEQLVEIPEVCDLLYDKQLNGTTPLMSIANNRNNGLFSILDHGIDLKKPVDDDNNTLLHIAVANLDKAKVEALLQRDPSLVNAKNSHGQTPLNYCLAKKSESTLSSISENLIGITDILKKYNADLNSTDDNGYKPIDYAIEKGWLSYNAYLLTNVNIDDASSYLQKLTVETVPSREQTFQDMLLHQLSDNPLVAASQLDKLYTKILKNQITVPQNYVPRPSSFLNFFSRSIPEETAHNNILKWIEHSYKQKLNEIPQFLSSDKIKGNQKKEAFNGYLPQFFKLHNLSTRIPSSQMSTLHKACQKAIEPKVSPSTPLDYKGL